MPWEVRKALELRKDFVRAAPRNKNRTRSCAGSMPIPESLGIVASAIQESVEAG